MGVGIRDHVTDLNALQIIVFFAVHTPLCIQKVILHSSTGYVLN